MKLLCRVALAVAVPLLIATSAQAQQQKNVRISQAFQSLLYLPLYVAKDAGFFEEEGVNVTISTGGGGSQSWSAVIGGSADYSIHDPVFPTISREKGGPGVVVGTICNAETMYALAKNPQITRTAEAKDLLTKGYKIATQPQPDSGWARVSQLSNELKVEPGAKTFTNLQVPIGSEMAAVFAGQADIGLSYPPVVEQAEAKGLHVVYSFTAASRPYLFSSLNTTREFIAKNAASHQAVMNAFERASQYIYAYPEEAVKIGLRQFPDLDPKIVRKAIERMIGDLSYPEHAYADHAAYVANQRQHAFVGTVKKAATPDEGIDNAAALAAYRKFGRIAWSGARPLKTVAK